MSKKYALVLLLGLAGCHRGNVADVTLDADRAAENATAAKTAADLAEADRAASAPMPRRIAPATPAEPTNKAAPAPEAPDAPSDGNNTDVSQQ